MHQLTITEGIPCKRKLHDEFFVDIVIAVTIQLSTRGRDQFGKSYDYDQLSETIYNKVKIIHNSVLCVATDEKIDELIENDYPVIAFEEYPTDEVLSQFVYDLIDGAFNARVSILSVSIQTNSNANMTCKYEGANPKRIVYQYTGQ